MFRTAMCPSSGELLYQGNTWFMSLCVGDCPVCIPDSLLHRVTSYKTVIHTEWHHTRQSSTQSNIIQDGHLHRVISYQTVIYTEWHHTRRSSTQSDIIPDSLLHRVTSYQTVFYRVTSYQTVIYTEWHHTRRSFTQSDINLVSHWYNNSPEDGHMAAQNMQRIEINVHENLCVKLVIYRAHTRKHGQQNTKSWELQ
jgi:hypothetical protein